MQLFITEYTKNGNTIVITNSDLLSQIRKVLRASIGDSIRIQGPMNEVKKTRYELYIARWDDKTIEGTVVSEQVHETTSEKRNMIIAMPNKWDKAELIVQKLTECGLNEIIFRPSERSIIKEWNSKKEERLHKIIKEAVEQSRGRNMPVVTFATDITQYLEGSEVIIFDKGIKDPSTARRTSEELKIKDSVAKDQRLKTKVGIVGPEGGLTKKDYQVFEPYGPKIVDLGETVLRMETAAIVGGRLLRNNVECGMLNVE